MPRRLPFQQQAEMEEIARENLRKAIDKRIREGDILPDLPGDVPIPGISIILKALGVPTGLAAAVGAYQAAEMTEKYWAPRLWDYYGVPIAPNGPNGSSTQRRRSMAALEPVEAPKPKRKVTTSNKALGGLYKFLVKQRKGKSTQKNCRLLLARCAKIIGKANPNTKSRIGKGTSANQKLARKYRKKYWGTTKHA